MKKTIDSMLNFLIIFLYIFIVTIVVVVLSGTVYHFYKGSDTLIAGIIAFIGAVIGGTITLVGVSKTLLENRRRDRLMYIPEIIKIIEIEKQYIFEFQMKLYDEAEKIDRQSYIDFLINFNSEFITRISEKNILACGEEIYTLYQKIIKGSFDLYMVTAQIPWEGYKPKVRTTTQLFEICTDFNDKCNNFRAELEKEYFRLDKNP